jgi:twitching motility protein PilT
MVTLNDALMDVVSKKLVEPKEAWMKAVDKTSLVTAMKQAGFDCSFADNEVASAAPAQAAGAPGAAPKPAMKR